jgi:polyphosphate kinase
MAPWQHGAVLEYCAIVAQQLKKASGTTLKLVEPASSEVPEPKAERPDVPRSLRDPSLYLNRELTWLDFNQRVLAEAEDPGNPLLERLKFLAIVANNLDEFFMKRIGGLKQQVGAGIQALTVDGRTPQQQIDECHQVILRQEARQRETLVELLKSLDRQGVRLAGYKDLSTDQRRQLRENYQRNVFPLVTPQARDPAHPFPFVSNLSLNLLVTVRYRDDIDQSMARVKVPVGNGIPRFLKIEDEHTYVPLEEVIAHNLDLLFPGMEIVTCSFFRVTRNANAERDEEEADDLLALIESELRDRRFAPTVRLEVDSQMPADQRGMLAAELGLDEHEDVFEVSGLPATSDLMEIASLEIPELRDPPHQPVDHPRLTKSRSIFHIIRDVGALLLQHPYESFSTSVERFLREASEDPKVRAIKMTLYRTSPESQILDYLCAAAQNGKQVAVVVELKARFDEAANIQFANRLEESGIHVTYGVVGLKTHAKVILVVRQDYNGLRRYAHIGTGNYHSGTARIYSDVGLLTCDEDIGADLTELFNYLSTGFRPKRTYRKLVPAPTFLKKALLAKIQREIDHQKQGNGGLIQFKMNALEDGDITRALYKASQAGVRVDLLVRDTCRLRPGIPGLSETVQVVSVLGRFLEHARIFYFRNGGAEEYLIGSADAMKRNLESRVEVVAPIEDPSLQSLLRTVIDVQLRPEGDGWWMRFDGTYERRWSRSQAHCQSEFIELAEKRHSQVNRLRKRRPRGPQRRAGRSTRN